MFVKLREKKRRRISKFLKYLMYLKEKNTWVQKTQFWTLSILLPYMRLSLERDQGPLLPSIHVLIIMAFNSPYGIYYT